MRVRERLWAAVQGLRDKRHENAVVTECAPLGRRRPAARMAARQSAQGRATVPVAEGIRPRAPRAIAQQQLHGHTDRTPLAMCTCHSQLRTLWSSVHGMCLPTAVDRDAWPHGSAFFGAKSRRRRVKVGRAVHCAPG